MIDLKGKVAVGLRSGQQAKYCVRDCAEVVGGWGYAGNLLSE